MFVVFFNMLNSYFLFIKFQILYTAVIRIHGHLQHSIILQNYDPVYPYCILANSDDRVHTLSKATLPSWVPKSVIVEKDGKGVAW